MRYLYSTLLLILTPLLVFRLLWKSRRLPAYRQRIGERFSLNVARVAPVDVWIHAVSLGEVVAATPLIERLLEQRLRLMVTTMTPTGSQQVLRQFGARVSHQYVPYDLPWTVRRFFKCIRPRVGIILETELWPNLIVEAKRFKVPLMLVNARISDRAYPQYRWMSFLLKPILNRFDVILAQSAEDARRLMALGANKEIVQVGGNLKFDVPVFPQQNRAESLFAQAWGVARPVIIAASTHEDEESQLLQRLPMLKQAIPKVLLLIAPRHPERFEHVFQLSQQLGFRTRLRSTVDAGWLEVDVIVLDSLGELKAFYALSDYAFVGGSFVPVGGHNVLEPIAAQVPVFCGPYMQNAKAICGELCQAQALKQVANADALVHDLIHLYQHDDERQAQMQSALAVLKRNQGAVENTLQWIKTCLE